MQTWKIEDLTPLQHEAVMAAFAILEPHFSITNLMVSDGVDVASNEFLKPDETGRPTEGYMGPVTTIEGRKYRMMPIYYASAKLGALFREKNEGYERCG